MIHDPHTTPDTELSQFRVKGEIPVPVLIGWLSLAAIPLLLFFAIRSHLRGDALIFAVLVTFSALLASNALWYQVSRNTTLQRRGFIVLITVLFTYLAVSAVEDGSAIMWLFAFPPIIFYISEARIGVIACSGGLSALILLFSPIGDSLFNTPYSTNFRLTMVAALGFEMVTCYILDQSRRRSKLGLIRLAADFEFAAKHDALTGLANRREAHHQLDTEHQRYLRHSRPFSVLLMDIDLFKSVNDNYGHQAGDLMIKLVARALRQQCRKMDTLSRWGGEEYLVVLPETGNAEALITAERIRQAIAEEAIAFEGQQVRATISAGVATICGDESVDRMLQRADEALYCAKSQGRNRVCNYETAIPGSAVG